MPVKPIVQIGHNDPDTIFKSKVNTNFALLAQVPSSTEDSGWVTTGFTAATGWTLGSCKYRRFGPVVTIRVSVTRSGGTITVPADGNVGNQAVAMLPPEITPSAYQPLSGTAFGGGPMSQGGVGTGGDARLNAVAPGTSLVDGFVLELGGTYML